MIGTELILQKLLCKGCHKKTKRFNEDLGLEVRKYPVKVRKEILI